MAKRKQQSEAERTALEAALEEAAEKTAAQPADCGVSGCLRRFDVTHGAESVHVIAENWLPVDKAPFGAPVERVACTTCGAETLRGTVCPIDGQVA